jgi:hypothetical protein
MEKKRSAVLVLAAAGAAMALLAGPAQADARVHLNIGVPLYTQPYVYQQPSYVYTQPGYVYTQPGYVYYGQHQYYDNHRRAHRGRDRDRDGIPNRYDRDRDGDGVPNRWDRRPNNGYRY